MELLRQGAVLVTEARAEFNGRAFAIAELDSAHVEAESEHAQRLGNILICNLAVAAALYFFVPIQIGIWQPKFYLAVGMFGLLALAVVDDILRSNSLLVHRLVLLRDGERTVALVTRDAAFAGRLEQVLATAIHRARSRSAAA